MSEIIISGPRHASIVQIYEPKQSPDQEEVIIDQFEMDGGEARPYDLPSATAAYRFTRLESHAVERMRRQKELEEDYFKPPTESEPAQEPREGRSPDVEQEMSTGHDAQAEAEKREEKVQKLTDKAERKAEKASRKGSKKSQDKADREKDEEIAQNTPAAPEGTTDYLEGGGDRQGDVDAGTPAADAAARARSTEVGPNDSSEEPK